MLMFALVGCGDNPRQVAINEALGFFKDAADNTRAVKTAVAEAVAKAEKNNTSLTEKDFKAAEDAAKKLHEYGKKLVDVKHEIDILKENTSTAEKERLDEQFQPRLQELFKRFQDEQAALDKELARAEKHSNQAAMKHLRDAITSSREEFVILTKPR
jgi:Zn-dependent oligopeptidase